MRHISSALLIAATSWACGAGSDATQPLLQSRTAIDSIRYDIAVLGSLGGSLSRGNSINSRGWVAGWSTHSTDGFREATLWRDSTAVPLGTLGGPSSNVQWPGQNNGSLIVGIAETAEADSLDEDWSCEAFMPESGKVCRGFVYENGEMRALPTFGGTHGFATGVNERGQVVGWAETVVHDDTCNEPQVLQFRAALWDVRTGTMTELPPFPGDSTSAATAINEVGQVVGISGECDVAVGRFSAQHAVLWENGTVTEIGNLGGTTWHTPMAINRRGVVVGFSNPPSAGDLVGDFNARAFIWSKEGGVDSLRALPGDAFSQAHAINQHNQVVGVSFGGAAGSRAFIWQNGTITNLNDLVDGSPGVLQSAQDINDAGQITGRVRITATGEVRTFILTPKVVVP